MKKIMVTGAGGFLGFEIVKQLCQLGYEVVGLQRSRYQKLADLGVAQVSTSLTDFEAVKKAMIGCDGVFHVAAKAGVWGSYASYYQANVLGTEHVINAAVACGVKRLVYTSSPSVTFAGVDELGVNESVPYAKKFLAHYPKTKAMAERLILKANSRGLKTVALRPHMIWGPGDTNLVPRVIARKKMGKLKIVGNGQNRVDHTYITNASYAHIQAYDALCEEQRCAGKAYYVSNGEPVAMKEMLNRILEAGGLEPLTKQIPAGLAYGVGCILESVYTLLRIKSEPLMTRFVAKQLTTSHYYDISQARRDFGYAPRVNLDQGMAMLSDSLQRASDVC